MSDYRVELIDTEGYKYYAEREIIDGLLVIRNLVNLRIRGTHDAFNYIVISNDNIAIYLESADDEIYSLYEKLYNKISNSCRSESAKRYYENCSNIVPEIEVLEDGYAGDIKVYNITDISGVKRGAELSLKAPLFRDVNAVDSNGFSIINKVLAVGQSVIVTTGEIIDLFSTTNIDINVGEDDYVFIAMNYMSEEVNKLYNKFKEWGNEDA